MGINCVVNPATTVIFRWFPARLCRSWLGGRIHPLTRDISTLWACTKTISAPFNQFVRIIFLNATVSKSITNRHCFWGMLSIWDWQTNVARSVNFHYLVVKSHRWNSADLWQSLSREPRNSAPNWQRWRYQTLLSAMRLRVAETLFCENGVSVLCRKQMALMKMTFSGVIRANRFARFARIGGVARIGNSDDSGEWAWRAIKIGAWIANDLCESIRANRVANLPCH